MRSVAIVLLVLVAGCLEQPASPPAPTSPTPTSPTDVTTPPESPTPPDTTPAFDQPVKNSTLDEGQQSGYHQAGRRVIVDAVAWAAFWAEHKPEEMLPRVDFREESVLVATLGQKANGCWAVTIRDMRDAGTGDAAMAATVTTYAPSADRGCITVVTHPYSIVLVRGADRTVEWDERTGEYA